jgi:chromosome segregation ATPase
MMANKTCIDTSLPELSQLIEQRLRLLHSLAESLESSSLALARNDAEAIARGAAHQAELCRQWSCLEDELRRRAERRSAPAAAGASGKSLGNSLEASSGTRQSAQLEAEWEALGVRIRYLTRVHWSLLRHLERSLAVLNRVVDSCAPTYMPNPNLLRTSLLQTEVRLEAAE